jgi:hypothetical protein
MRRKNFRVIQGGKKDTRTHLERTRDKLQAHMRENCPVHVGYVAILGEGATQTLLTNAPTLAAAIDLLEKVIAQAKREASE